MSSSSSKIGNLYRQLDIFGTVPNLNINKHSKNKTLCGSTVTLLIGMISILMIVNSSKDLIKKRNPSTTFSQQLV